jgi:hypothetical protein
MTTFGQSARWSGHSRQRDLVVAFERDGRLGHSWQRKRFAARADPTFRHSTHHSRSH